MIAVRFCYTMKLPNALAQASSGDLKIIQKRRENLRVGVFVPFTYSALFSQRNSECLEETRNYIQILFIIRRTVFSPILVNLKDKVGPANVFSNAFVSNEAKHGLVCTDCLFKCLFKREYTAKLPNNFQHLLSLKR